MEFQIDIYEVGYTFINLISIYLMVLGETDPPFYPKNK